VPTNPGSRAWEERSPWRSKPVATGLPSSPESTPILGRIDRWRRTRVSSVAEFSPAPPPYRPARPPCVPFVCQNRGHETPSPERARSCYSHDRALLMGSPEPPTWRRREGPAGRLAADPRPSRGPRLQARWGAQQLINPLGTNPTGSAAALLPPGPPFTSVSRNGFAWTNPWRAM